MVAETFHHPDAEQRPGRDGDWPFMEEAVRSLKRLTGRLDHANTLVVAILALNGAVFPITMGFSLAETIPNDWLRAYGLLAAGLMIFLVVVLSWISGIRRRGDVLYDAISDELSHVVSSNLSSLTDRRNEESFSLRGLVANASIVLKDYAKAQEVPVIGSRAVGASSIIIFGVTIAVNFAALKGLL